MQVQEGCKNYYVLRRNYLTDNFCTGETTRRRGRRYLHKAVRYAGLFFWGCRVFFCFQVSFCPVKRGNRAGSSQNEFDYSRRGTQISFPFLDCRSCENFGLYVAHFSTFFVEKKRLSNRAPFLINCHFSHYTIEKWAGPKFSQLRLSRSGKKLTWVPLREWSDSFRQEPARFPCFTGQKLTWKQKKIYQVCLQPTR